MFTFLIIVITIIGALMVAVILLQSGKGGGLSGMVSGGATRQVLGARQAPDVLERGTWTLATAFIVLCLITNFIGGSSEQEESIMQQQSQQSSEPVAPLEGNGGGQGQGQQQSPNGGGGGGQQQGLPPANGNSQSQQ